MSYLNKVGFDLGHHEPRQPFESYIEYFTRENVALLLEEIVRSIAALILIFFALFGVLHAVVGSPAPTVPAVYNQLKALVAEPEQFEETEQP